MKADHPVCCRHGAWSDVRSLSVFRHTAHYFWLMTALPKPKAKTLRTSFSAAIIRRWWLELNQTSDACVLLINFNGSNDHSRNRKLSPGHIRVSWFARILSGWSILLKSAQSLTELPFFEQLMPASERWPNDSHHDCFVSLLMDSSLKSEIPN